MRIVVDGDACPVLALIEDIAKEYQFELIVLSDTNHYLELDYGTIIIVDQQRDGVDYKIVNLVKEGDLVITQDYGLASMCLARKTRILHPKGFEYTLENIDELLFSRYVGSKVRKSHQKKHLSGPSKRTKEDDDRFETKLLEIINIKE